MRGRIAASRSLARTVVLQSFLSRSITHSYHPHNYTTTGEFRSAIILGGRQRQDDDATQRRLLRAVTCSALAAAIVAILVVAIVAIPLAVLSRGLSDHVEQLIEGVSKLVAAICVVQLSLKMPKWLGFYKSIKRSNGKVESGLDMTVSTIRFNVAWNVWREVAECGVFLLPSFLSHTHLGEIPISMILGMVVGGIVGFGIYMANQRMRNKFYLAIFTTLVVVFLAAGLFVGGIHEFEEALGDTRQVYAVRHPFWSSDQLPMVLLKPFGYTSTRTVLQMVMFWLWLLMTASLHYWKICQTRRINEQVASGKLSVDDDHMPVDEEKGTNSDVPSSVGDGDVVEEDPEQPLDVRAVSEEKC
jgi:high-affinity iron transporter